MKKTNGLLSVWMVILSLALVMSVSSATAKTITLKRGHVTSTVEPIHQA